MGYDKSKFSLVSQGLAAHQEWHYYDTGGESVAGYMGVGWFTDAKDRGVDTGDYVTIYNASSKLLLSGLMVVVQDTGATQGSWKRDTGI